MKYYKYKVENLIKISDIIIVHYLEIDKNFFHEAEKHDFWEVVYVDKGSVAGTADGENFSLSQGEMIFHKPNELHSLSATKDENGDSVVIVISFECKSEAVHFFENKTLSLKTDELKLFYSIVKEAKRTFDIPFSDPRVKKLPLKAHPTLGGLQLIKNYLEILLITVLRNETEKDGENKVFIPPAKSGGVAEKIISILNKNVYGILKIDEIAAEMNYSKSYIFRTFKKQTGSSIIAYFNNLKIDRAKKMLKDTDLSITEISDTLGFDTQSYFSKAFKKNTGVSPLKYKKIYC